MVGTTDDVGDEMLGNATVCDEIVDDETTAEGLETNGSVDEATIDESSTEVVSLRGGPTSATIDVACRDKLVTAETLPRPIGEDTR